MIADHGNPSPPAPSNLLGAGEHRAAEGIVAGFSAATRNVDRRTGGTERDRDTLADSQTRSSYESDSIFQHVRLLPNGARRYSRTSSPVQVSSPRRDSSDAPRLRTCCPARSDRQ